MTKPTARLFWTFPSLLELDADVVRADRRGDAWAVVLDRTAFFPAAGGQPSDRGTIAPFETASGLLRSAGRIVDVLEEGDTLVHIVEGLDSAPSGTVRCVVDAKRRGDLACQHTAQHVVSAVATELYGARTVGFHLGERVTTVDLEGGDLDAEKFREIERAANAAVREDRPVRVAFESGRARRVGLEMVREEGELRIVSIDGLQDSACCGSHVDRTARIGAIRLGKIERVHTAIRVELFAGDRVLAETARLAGILSALSEKTGAGVDELPGWADAALAEARALKRENAELGGRAAAFEAEALLSKAEPIGDGRLVARVVSERDVKAVKILAASIRREPRLVAVVGASCDGKAALVVARTPDMALDVRPILKAAAEALGAKGGGTADLAQCGGGDPLRLDAAIELGAGLVRAALEKIAGR
jgi:alanyl-tRNA synthetase